MNGSSEHEAEVRGDASPAVSPFSGRGEGEEPRNTIEAREGQELLRIQRDLVADLSAMTRIDDALARCLDVALHISGMDCGGVYLVDPETGSVDLAVHRNLPKSVLLSWSHYDSTSPNARIVAAGKPVYSSFKEIEIVVPPCMDLVSLAIIPISYHGNVVACLNLGSSLPLSPEQKVRVALETVVAVMGGTLMRMRAEEERVRLTVERAGDEFFKMVASNAPVGIFLTDGEGNCRYVNTRWCQMVGMTTEESMGRGWRRAVHPGDRKGLIARWKAASGKVQSFDSEHRLITRDGTTLWAAVSGLPARDHKGRLLGYVGTVTDITAQKQAEEELRTFSSHLEAAREEERRNMSREIHDELGQALTAARIELGLLSKNLEGLSREGIVGVIESTRSLIDSSIQTVKRISTGLRPLILDELGICSAIEWQASEFEKRTGITCTVHIPNRLDLDQDVSTALFRILQEALTNVARHAFAGRVTVRLRRTRKRIVLEIADNGKGIGPEKTEDRNSFGLMGMRERARAIGGTVAVSGAAGRGTRLLALIPIDTKGGRE